MVKCAKGNGELMNRIMQQPNFSIIIPVYNIDEYIQRAYDSINEQSVKDIEIIFVNDNSSDDSLKKIKYLAEKDSRIKIINRNLQDVHGAGISRNIGFQKSRGKYIYFMDGDDYLEHNALHFIKSKLDKTNSEVLIFGFNSVSGINGNVTYSSKQSSNHDFININEEERAQIIVDTYFKNSLYVVWNKVYNRKFLIKNEISFPNTRTAQDAFFNLIALSQVKKLSVISNPFYYYVSDRVESNQNIQKSKFEDEYNLLKKLEDMLQPYKSKRLINKLLMFERIRILKNEVSFVITEHNIKPWSNLQNKTEFKKVSSELSVYESILYDKKMKSLFEVLFLKFPNNNSFKMFKIIRNLKNTSKKVNNRIQGDKK